MQQSFFAIGHFLQDSLSLLSAMGWIPVIAISVLLGFGLVFWLNLQGKYSRKAAKNGTLI
jgi:plasmid maintenance system antidote protein VapI